ncbi:MAG TPA: hypothetical protein DEQ87_18195 [Algoriphagus sp.]|jgi:hypothetical protein|uniref:hypothetical protein n=1 Tax=unclassified Algoriphagus TaxID=2641541 RepID=UPI000C3D7C22|nr:MULTISPECIES: hypothetical protein [unclassified Algoriphagus]MAL15336.1 hypothetical protein [Algoriphagus sp.]MAN85873.1 hypothetical protein [Algoriphagus sp.]HAH37251.1 hypothetical protein [Algoriphagus sp.]HCB45165.1 hypothetical protein [Algoriphagus sp.]HCD89545.1 hypothetical protein [Algoriphagus sp.]|tara:strand:- start:3836 stop:4735 length:900 start_codon:yes stop_codon:yes gene_type:complete
MRIPSFFHSLYTKLLSEKTKAKGEGWILGIAIGSFIIHLILIFLADLGFYEVESELFENPISAIYTPFSFILVYEVYLLVYFLPKSFTTYIGKQYEIISLIIIRRLFKDLATLELSSDWFQIKDDLQFTYDLLTSVALFFLLLLFYKNSKKQETEGIKTAPSAELKAFIQFKKLTATILVPILLGIAIYTLGSWSTYILFPESNLGTSFKNINAIFFDEFFMILIIVDVILLLASFYYTDEFHKVMRNSGFIVSTILIRLSFSVEGLMNNFLILAAICFGLVIMVIHNQYEKAYQNEKK